MTTRPTPHARGEAPAHVPAKRFNRSSFEGDFLIVIPNQTAEDFERYAPESQICEYFDGTVFMPSPATDRHQEHTLFLSILLDGFCEERFPAQVLNGPAVLRLTEEHKPEPDIFVRPRGAAEGAAVLVIEVLSPSNREHDLDFKAEYYQEAGLPEIWYVDGRDQVVYVDRRAPDGSYQRLALTEGLLAPPSLPGFWIDVSWLWSDPLPSRRRCLETILAGPPPA